MQTAPVLSGVNGIFVLAPDGLAGRVEGTLTLDAAALPAGLSLGGTFGLAVNRTSREVHESVTFDDGTTVTLDLRTGPFLRVSGEGVTLTVSGQTLTGNIALEQYGAAAPPPPSSRSPACGWPSVTAPPSWCASRTPAAPSC